MEKVIAIEGLRAACSIYVFLSHLVIAGLGIKSPAVFPLFFGQEAVIVFFIVSGFVIALSVGRGDLSFRDYLRHRLLRIYPIFLLALVLSGALAGFHFDWKDSLGNLLMLQDFAGGKPGVLFDTFAGNAALWSLSYEWWFYLMFFPVYSLVPRRRQCAVVTCGGLMAAGAYNMIGFFQPLLFLAYFPIWWAGAELGRAYVNEEEFPRGVLLSMLLMTLAFAIPVVTALAQRHTHGPGIHPLLELRHAAACLLFLGAARALWNRKWEIGARTRRLVVVLGSISYGLYVLHFPIITTDYWGHTPPWLRVTLAIPLVFAAAWLAEYPYQRLWRGLSGRNRSSLEGSTTRAIAPAPVPRDPARPA
ncbi:acyltransferase family protein [Pseudorhodoplanes sp.]|uniref:acyltransferase family protein n=1 Tax=Pseudorhodoplanes sp. TaxID=1934341 RepID=UPI003D1425FD